MTINWTKAYENAKGELNYANAQLELAEARFQRAPVTDTRARRLFEQAGSLANAARAQMAAVQSGSARQLVATAQNYSTASRGFERAVATDQFIYAGDLFADATANETLAKGTPASAALTSAAMKQVNTAGILHDAVYRGESPREIAQLKAAYIKAKDEFEKIRQRA